MESIVTEKGVTLLGEAAKAYITYKYFDSILAFSALIIIFGVVSFALYKGLKYMADH